MEHTSSGTYATLVPDDSTKERIYEIIDLLNIPNHVNKNSMHVTVVYSRVVCPTISTAPIVYPITATGSKFDMFKSPDGNNCLVLLLESELMHELHNHCVTVHGATHDFPSYQPHITLSYDYPFPDMPNPTLLDYFKNLTFDRYVVEPLVFEWYEP